MKGVYIYFSVSHQIPCVFFSNQLCCWNLDPLLRFRPIYGQLQREVWRQIVGPKVRTNQGQDRKQSDALCLFSSANELLSHWSYQTNWTTATPLSSDLHDSSSLRNGQKIPWQSSVQDSVLPLQGAWVCFGGLRSYKLYSEAKKKKKSQMAVSSKALVLVSQCHAGLLHTHQSHPCALASELPLQEANRLPGGSFHPRQLIPEGCSHPPSPNSLQPATDGSKQINSPLPPHQLVCSALVPKVTPGIRHLLTTVVVIKAHLTGSIPFLSHFPTPLLVFPGDNQYFILVSCPSLRGIEPQTSS